MATPTASDSAVPAQDQLNGIINEDVSKGRVAVHTFDPDASPQDKAAAAGKSRDQLNSVNQNQNGHGTKELALDTGKSGVIPTINVQDVDRPEQVQQEVPVKPLVPKSVDPVPPGALPDAPAPLIPDWYRVGWRSVSGIDAPQLTDADEKEKSVLDLFLAEQYYGDWYHNAAVIFFAVFASHFLTRFYFGWGWLFIVLAICTTYFTTSNDRFYRRARDDIQRSLVKIRLLNEHESADWINNFLDRFWLIYEPVLSQTIVLSVDQVLSTNTPAFLDSLRLSTFTLGTKAPRIDKVKTFPHTEDDIIVMDWGFSFTPNDISNLTPRQAADKVNPKIVLSVRIGKGLATAAVPILLEDISLTGLIRIRLKLMTNFPHVQLLSFSFLEKPVIDYVLKPLGGETFGFDINNIPGLSSCIREITHSILGPMMYDPSSYTLNLEQLLSGAPLDVAIGVLQVTIQSARSLKGNKLGGGSPDPFITLSINERQELARTKYKACTFNPTWMETKFILVNSLADSLVMTVYDYNDHRKNTLLGSTTFSLEKLKDDATLEGLESPILKDGKDRGQLRYDVSFYPVLKEQTVDGKQELPETNVGIVRLVVHQAKELDASKSLSGELNPFAQILVGHNPTPVHSTPRFKHTNNPIWESATEFLCTDKSSSVITVKVIDDRDFLKDPLVGYMSVQLAGLLESQQGSGRDWWPLSGCKSGRLRMSAEWKPLSIAGSLQGIQQFTPPIGVLRLLINKAIDVKNVEATLGGKSDPYIRVQSHNVTKGRTEVANNNLNPVWDQILYIPVHSLKETLLLECMDYQNLTKDRSLGSVELRISGLATKSSDPKYPYESTGVKDAADPIQLDGGDVYKGTLYYSAQFIPALALKGVTFEGRPNELELAAEGADDGDGDGGDAVDDVESVSTPPVPEGITVWHPYGIDAAAKAPTDKPHRKTSTSTDSNSAHTASTSASAETEASAPKLVEMGREELLQQQSGIIVFNVLSGNLAKKARLEVLLDDGYWPVFATVKSRSTRAIWEHVGEGFIKEIDFAQVSLRLDESSNDEKDDIVAEWKGDAKAFLKLALDGPHTFTFVHNDEKTTSTVDIEARYVPVPVKLDAREKMSNQGVLRVDLLDGSEITGVDRGGKSDPFAVFLLNGQRVFKSQVKKKTLTPDWNENFVTPVPSRVGADFSIEIFDWNQIEQAKSLGSAKINLEDIEPFQAVERTLQLMSSKHGEKGVVRVRLLFQPEIIAKSRQKTSTFSVASRTMTNIGAVPLGAGKGVFQGVAGVFRKDTGKNKVEEIIPPIPKPPAGQASKPIVPSDPTSAPTVARENGTESIPSEPGVLKVTVLDAKDLSASDIKPYVLLRVGGSEYKTKHAGKTVTPEWNETFTFSAGSTTPKLYVWIYDHKTITRDKVFGEGEIDIWRHVTGTSPTEVLVELQEGHGQLRIRLEFNPGINPLGRGSSSISVNRSNTMSSPTRFSMRGRRTTVNTTDQDD